jgi:hypothetical protein
MAKRGSHDATAVLEKAARELQSQLGADHPETLRARLAIARLRA